MSKTSYNLEAAELFFEEGVINVGYRAIIMFSDINDDVKALTEKVVDKVNLLVGENILLKRKCLENIFEINGSSYYSNYLDVFTDTLERESPSPFEILLLDYMLSVMVLDIIRREVSSENSNFNIELNESAIEDYEKSLKESLKFFNNPDEDDLWMINEEFETFFIGFDLDFISCTNDNPINLNGFTMKYTEVLKAYKKYFNKK